MNEAKMSAGADAGAEMTMQPTPDERLDAPEPRPRRRRRRPTSPMPLSHWAPKDGPEPVAALRDKRTGTEWLLPHAPSFVVGSGSDADLDVDRTYVSRKHCTISRRGAWLHVEDHSKNGTFFEGQRCDKFDIAPGNHFGIAYTEVTVATAPMLVAAAELGRYLGFDAHVEIDRAIRMGAAWSAVVLVGEDGTGHEAVANILHGCSLHRTRHVVRARSAAEIRAALADNAGGLLLRSDDFAKQRLDRRLANELNERANQGTLNIYVRAQSNEEVNQLGLGTSTHDVLQLPPLRSRARDLRALVERQLRSGRWHLDADALGARAFQKLARAPWPGNLDELSGLVAHLAVLLEHGGDLKAAAAFLSVKPAVLRALAKRLELSFQAQERKAARSISKRRHQRRT